MGGRPYGRLPLHRKLSEYSDFAPGPNFFRKKFKEGLTNSSLCANMYIEREEKKNDKGNLLRYGRYNR